MFFPPKLNIIIFFLTKSRDLAAKSGQAFGCLSARITSPTKRGRRHDSELMQKLPQDLWY